MKKEKLDFDRFKNKFIEMGLHNNQNLPALIEVLLSRTEEWHLAIEHKGATRIDRCKIDEKILALLTLESRDAERRFYFTKLSRLNKESLIKIAHNQLKYENFFPVLGEILDFKAAEDLTGYPFNFFEYVYWRDMKSKNDELTLDEFLYSMFSGVSKEHKLLPEIYSDFSVDYLVGNPSVKASSYKNPIGFLSNFSRLVYKYNPAYPTIYDESIPEHLLCFELDLLLHNIFDSVNAYFVGANIKKLRETEYINDLLLVLGDISGLNVNKKPVKKFKNAKKIAIIGDFNGTSGLAENAMILAKALSKVGPLLLMDTRTGQCSSNADFNLSAADHVIFAVNPPDLLDVYSVFGRTPFTLKNSSILCLWEFETIPPEYLPGLEMVKNILTPSEFIKKALNRSGFLNVDVISKPIELKDVKLDRDPLMPVTFYCTFDVDSSVERKNPRVILEAFKEEFTNSDNARLIIKSTPLQINHWGDPNKMQSFIDKEALSDPRIVLIKNKLSHHEYKSLLLGADVIVSTHRCEGFGYTMAEAVGYGKSLVCPSFSGESDYLNLKNHYAVDFHITHVPLNCLYRYTPMARWIDVDKSSLKKQMRLAYAKSLENLSKFAVNLDVASEFRARYNSDVFVAELMSVIGRD